MAILHFLSG